MDITIARITQLVFRTIVLVLVAKAGIDSQHAATIAAPASELAGAGIALLADLFIHSARFGALASLLESMANDSLTPNSSADTTTTTTPNGGGTPNGKLTKTANAVLLLLGVGFALCIAACGPAVRKPAAAVASLNTVGASATDSFLLNHQISVKTAEKVSDASQLVEKAIDAWDAAIVAGDPATIKAAQANVNTQMTAYNASVAAARAEASAPQPTTTPAPTTIPASFP